MNIRTLYANEIEARVGTIRKNGCSLLLYKDARVDMKILDEVFGPKGWQRTHELINGNLFCNIEIWDDEKKCWVRKQDVGTESFTEKEKGQASDAFKRAGFNVGIGRELYTAPFIWIKLDEDETSEKSGKFYLNPRVNFSVKEISYKEREIDRLIIVDQKGNTRFEVGSKATEKQVKEYTQLTQKKEFDFVKMKDFIFKTYGAHNIAELTSNQMDKVIEVLKEKPDKK
jgi:hypothetical protein